MGQKLKNLLIPKKPILLGVLFFFIFLGITTPVEQICAQEGIITSLLLKPAMTIANAVIGAVLQVVIIIGNILLTLAAALLDWVTGPGFISLSYTKPAGNPILQLGWTLTRDLANIGFVVVLIIIGLATALRIKEYQWQKTLPALIGVILLINFTPVIIGVVVDASNIVMNFFLKNVKGWSIFTEAFSNQFSNIGDLFVNIVEGRASLFEATSIFLGKSVVFAVFSFTAAAILFVYTALFIMRYVAIWVLVILSPLAFLAYILPKTRDYFFGWWKQLIQWSFIGVIAAFFLYLSHRMTEGISELGATEYFKYEATGERITGGVLDILLPHFIVVAFLYFAFFVGLKTSAYGADTIIGWAKGREKTIGKWMGRKARRAAQKTIGEERWKRLADRLTGAKGGITSRLLTAPLRPIGRGMMSIREAERKDAAKAEDEAKKKERDAGRNVSEIRKQIILKEWAKIGGTLAGIVERGQAKDAIQLGLKPGEIRKAVVNLIKIGEKERAEKIARGFLRYVVPEDMGFELSDIDRQKGYETYTQKLIAEAKTAEEIESLGSDVFVNPADIEDLVQRHRITGIQDAMHQFWTGSQINKAGDKFGAAALSTIQRGIEGRTTEGTLRTPRWYAENNPSQYRYLKSSAAQNLGIGFRPFEEYRLRELATEYLREQIRNLQGELEKTPTTPARESQRRRLTQSIHELSTEIRERAVERPGAPEEAREEEIEETGVGEEGPSAGETEGGEGGETGGGQ